VPLVVDPDRIEITAIRELVEIDGRRVVEIGCGDGRITFQYTHEAASVLAFDTDAEAVADARAATPDDVRDKVRFEVADAAQIELPDGEFDLAIFSWSL
jgi:avermectin B 5-O-methyltransferase